MVNQINVPVFPQELRTLFDALQIESKAQEGFVHRVIRWEAKRRPGSQIVEYWLTNGWRLALAHRWRDATGQWSRLDPKAIWLDQVRLSPT